MKCRIGKPLPGVANVNGFWCEPGWTSLGIDILTRWGFSRFRFCPPFRPLGGNSPWPWCTCLVMITGNASVNAKCGIGALLKQGICIYVWECWSICRQISFFAISITAIILLYLYAHYYNRPMQALPWRQSYMSVQQISMYNPIAFV